MPVDLVFGTPPGEDDILRGATEQAQQNIQRQGIQAQIYQAQLAAQVQAARIGLAAQGQAFNQAMRLAPYNSAAENALMAFASMDPNAMVPGNSPMAAVGASMLGGDSNYVSQGAYDNPNAPLTGTPAGLSTNYNPYAGQGWMGAVGGADAIANGDEDDSGEGFASDD